MQILTACIISEVSPDIIFEHIFYRDFNIDDSVASKSDKLLNPGEITELESDIPIRWNNDDINYATSLIRLTLENNKELDAIIESFAENWDLERIALVDKILMKIALTELLKFPDIPIKVSVNEAIEISKKYSTSKSNIFINGILDSLLIKFKKEGRISKKGRGLIDK
jgi:transcription antitermination factor NusB